MSVVLHFIAETNITKRFQLRIFPNTDPFILLIPHTLRRHFFFLKEDHYILVFCLMMMILFPRNRHAIATGFKIPVAAQPHY